MINVNKIKGRMAEKGISGQEMAKIIGITPKTFYKKMKNGVFDSAEMETMADTLEFEDPISVFFAKEVTCQVTNERERPA